MKESRERPGTGEGKSGSREESREGEREARKAGGEGPGGEVSVKCLKYCL